MKSKTKKDMMTRHRLEKYFNGKSCHEDYKFYYYKTTVEEMLEEAIQDTIAELGGLISDEVRKAMIKISDKKLYKMDNHKFERGTFGTEDENNNWLIDCWLTRSEWDKRTEDVPVSKKSAVGVPTVTVIITKENYTDNKTKQNEQ